jgi:serpin B
VGPDIEEIRLPEIEIPSHRGALEKALMEYGTERAAGRKQVKTPLSGRRRSRRMRVAVSAAAVISLGLVALLVFFLVGTAINGESGRTMLSESRALAARIETRAAGFDFALFREVYGEDGGENVCLSPLSARIALAMAYNGASDEVAREMAYVLDFEGMSLEDVNAMMRDLQASLRDADEDVLLEIANSIWGDEGLAFDPGFRQRCVECYDAEVGSVDFQGWEAAGAIDAWVDEKTHGNIPDITEGLDLDTISIAIINALYMKGTWTQQFDPGMTGDRDFHLPDGGTKKVPTMHQAGSYDYYENGDFQAVSLPYGDGRLSMYIFLPREGESLESFIGGLDRESWEDWMAAFEVREGAIGLPRFEMDYEKDLTPALSSMGMGSAFLPGDAFPDMASIHPLWINHVFQGSHIDVNEEGTEATAITMIGITSGIDIEAEQPFLMEMDRPFFFAIGDNRTGTLLFMGSVVEP